MRVSESARHSPLHRGDALRLAPASLGSLNTWTKMERKTVHPHGVAEETLLNGSRPIRKCGYEDLGHPSGKPHVNGVHTIS